MAAAAHPETECLQPLKTSKSFEFLPPDMSEHRTEGAGSTTTKSKPRRHLNLVLCGRRGAGKTSAAKVILGQTELQWVSSSSECVRNQGEVCRRWLSLVELPALYGKAPQEVMEESFRCISLCDPEGVHAFLLVLHVGPLTDEDKGELQTIQDTFSSGVDDFTMILFTVDSDPTAPAVVESVERDRDIQELLESCGGRSVVLNIRNQQQVPDLLEKVETMSAEGPRCFSTRIFSRAFSEKVSKLLADLQAERQKNEAGDVQREHLLKELQREREKRGRKRRKT
nr:GTPase IMAP family member 6 [Nothobranchius furzeri]